jgi:hypothetical protein
LSLALALSINNKHNLQNQCALQQLGVGFGVRYTREPTQWNMYVIMIIASSVEYVFSVPLDTCNHRHV